MTGAAPELLAICAALFFASSHVLSKRGLVDTSVLAGVLVSLGTGTMVLGFAALADPPTHIDGRAVGILALSGILAPAMARGFAIAGIDRLGPSVSVPVQGSIYPLFAVIGAVAFLSESPPPIRWLGAVLVAVGLWTLSRKRPRAMSPGLLRASQSRMLRAGLVFPIVAGTSKGLADIVRKTGLDLMPHATLGSFIGVTSALVVVGAYAATVPAIRHRVSFGRGTAWFAGGGFLAALAVLTQFHALNAGDVSVVSPIVASQPLFVLVLSMIMLRGVEKLTPRIAAGALTILAGTVLISL